MKVRSWGSMVRLLFAVLVLSGGLVYEVRAAEPSPIAEAAAIVEAFHAALAKGDTGAALGLLDDDVTIFEQGWVERSKAEYASHHLQSDAEFSRFVTSKQTAQSGAVVGDLAYVTTESTVTGKYKDKDVDLVSIETMVLKRAEPGWRIVHIHWSSRKAKE